MAAKQSVIDEAMKLPEEDRLEIAQTLYESVEGPADPEAQELWSREIERRLREIDAGRATLVPWEEARRQILGGRSDESTSR